MSTRPPAVAGFFYPSEASTLRAEVAALMAAAEPGDARPKALIAPHAGYQYSGPIAATAYRLLEPVKERIERVVLLGPAHTVYLQGMALPSDDTYATPLGALPVDTEAVARVLALPDTCLSDAAHAREHSLEVHLPFLQFVLGDFALVPIVVGDCAPQAVAAVLEELWGGDETLIVVSSDLSHYHPYRDAQARDAQTSRAIEAQTPNLTGEQACGAHAVNGLLVAAHARHMSVTVLDVRNSGDTAGDRSQVVGYGAFAIG